MGFRFSHLSILMHVCRMENMNMTELQSIAREYRLIGYSRLRKAELINFLCENNLRVSPRATWGPQTEDPPLTKRQT